MRPGALFVLWVVAASIVSCHVGPKPPPTTGAGSNQARSVAAPASAESRAKQGAHPRPTNALRRDAAAPPPSRAAVPIELPHDIDPGRPVTLAVPEDREVHVIHGEASTARAIVYLHGVCGDIRAIRSWAKAVSPFATLIALHGDEPCGDPSRFRWSPDIIAIDRRIRRAVDVVAQSRGGHLEAAELAIFGYSQGATRASALARELPDRYTRVVLGGSPSTPSVTNLSKTKAVVVIGGQYEAKDHMGDGVEALKRAGKRVAYFELPRASHGQYGPEAEPVLARAFAFLFE